MNCTQIKNSSLEPQNGKLAIKHFQVENKKWKIENDYSKCHYNSRKIENTFFLESDHLGYMIYLICSFFNADSLEGISGFLPDMFNQSCTKSVVYSFDWKTIQSRGFEITLSK